MGKIEEVKAEIRIGMIIQLTHPANAEDENDHAIGWVSDVIQKPGLSDLLWGISFKQPPKAHEKLFWHWGSEISIVSELGFVEDVDGGEILSQAVDGMAHEIIALAIDELGDKYPGISKYTVVGSKTGGQRLIDLLEDQMVAIVDSIDR